jgi:hypothetical protein
MPHPFIKVTMFFHHSTLTREGKPIAHVGGGGGHFSREYVGEDLVNTLFIRGFFPFFTGIPKYIR